jgi:flagella basal body P-ring formation protein FlgA
MMTLPQMLNLSLRIAILVLCLTVGLMFLFAGAKAALAATIRPVVIQTGEQLTVGDIFTGLDTDKAAYVLGPGPAPGKDMVLDARTLMRIAIALDLPWRPDSSADTVTVRRDATVIGTDNVTAALTEAIKSEGVNSGFEIAYSGGDPVLALAPGLPATLDVVALQIDRTQDVFHATVSAPSADDPQVTRELVGTLRRTVEVPVLRNSLRSGDIIGERDIDMVKIYEREVQPDMILDAESLVGLTPRRIVSAGKPVRNIDVEMPELVARGDSVTLVFDSAPLYLTAKGKALQNGGKGDLVRVINIASNRSIEGVVTGDRQVTVAP